jgi:hypothetical protein
MPKRTLRLTHYQKEFLLVIPIGLLLSRVIYESRVLLVARYNSYQSKSVPSIDRPSACFSDERSKCQLKQQFILQLILEKIFATLRQSSISTPYFERPIEAYDWEPLASFKIQLRILVRLASTNFSSFFASHLAIQHWLAFSLLASCTISASSFFASFLAL